jgi:hypothetical protein
MQQLLVINGRVYAADAVPPEVLGQLDGEDEDDT